VPLIKNVLKLMKSIQKDLQHTFRVFAAHLQGAQPDSEEFKTFVEFVDQVRLHSLWGDGTGNKKT
jgi:hypothetical protein